MSDEEYVRHLLTGSTPFTREKLVPDAGIAVYYVSSVERQARSLSGAPQMCGGDPMYVSYDLPLPLGASAGPTGGGIGILDMGKITPVVEWPALSRTMWHLGGCLGNKTLLFNSSSNGLFVISGGKIVRARGDFGDYHGSDHGIWPSLPGGATCAIARTGQDFYLEARSASGADFRLVDARQLNAALRGFEKRPFVKASCFRFAQHDFVEFGADTSTAVLYRIDSGALTLIGAGNVWGGDAEHILMMDDEDWPRRWFNEERAPR